MSAVPIVALDVAGWGAAERIVEELGDSCRFYKVGLELFTAEGPRAVRELRDRGCDVFLDLKFHDIPNTVRGAVRSAAALGVRLVTVHASGGLAMLEAAVEGAEREGAVEGTGSGCGVLAVSVLTSLDAGQLGRAWGRAESELAVPAEVLRLADTAAAAGAYGLVCSGEEARLVRERHGPRLSLLVPGIRLRGDSADDQARVVTPEAAIAAGASYLVLGRSVTRAADRRAAMAEVHGAIAEASRMDEAQP